MTDVLEIIVYFKVVTWIKNFIPQQTLVGKEFWLYVAIYSYQWKSLFFLLIIESPI